MAMVQAPPSWPTAALPMMSGSQLAQACALANRNLSRREWERLVGPSHPTCPDLPEG